MFRQSIYKNKRENAAEVAKDFFYKSKRFAKEADETFRTVAWAAGDINQRMKAGNERAFGKYKRR